MPIYMTIHVHYICPSNKWIIYSNIFLFTLQDNVNGSVTTTSASNMDSEDSSEPAVEESTIVRFVPR